MTNYPSRAPRRLLVGCPEARNGLPRGHVPVHPPVIPRDLSGAPCWVNPSLSGSLRHLERGGQLDLQARPRPPVSGQSEGWDQVRGRKEWTETQPSSARDPYNQWNELSLISQIEYSLFWRRDHGTFKGQMSMFFDTQAIFYLFPVDESCAS